MIVLFVAIYFLLAIMATVNRRWGAYALWFAIWLYPVSLLHNLLPLSVRFDDLYIVWLFLMVVIFERRPNRPSPLVVLGVLWFFSVVIANIIGVATEPDAPIGPAVIRQAGKSSYIPMIAIIISRTCRNAADLRRHLAAIMSAGVLIGIIGILQVLTPSLVAIWQVPLYLYNKDLFDVEKLAEEARRAGGGLGIMYFAFTMMTISALAVRLCTAPLKLSYRVWTAIASLVTCIALIYSNTRGAIGGLIVGTLYMLVAQRKRALIVLFGFAVVLFLIFQGELIERVESRFTGQQESIGASTNVRLEIWKAYLDNFSIHYLFFGRGWVPERVRVGFSAHSSYIGALAYTGLVGVIITTGIFYQLWKVAKLARGCQTDKLLMYCGYGLQVTIIATLFAGIFVEEIQSSQLRLLLALGVMLEQVYAYYRNDRRLRVSRREIAVYPYASPQLTP